MNTANDETKSTKRRRKETGDGLSKAERKRELDRIAQRATRERTKNKIADLEQRLASLESGDEHGEIAQLTKTVGDLRSENVRYQNALVKMKFAINEALGEIDGTGRRDSTSTMSNVPLINGSRSNSMVDVLPEEPSGMESMQPNEIVVVSSSFAASTQSQRLQPLYDAQGYRPPTPHEYSNIDLNSIFEFFEYGPGNPFSNPSPLTGRMPPAGGFLHIAPDEHKWDTSDEAFRRGLAVNPMLADLDESLLAKAIMLGWDSIGLAAQHPILLALQCIDQRVFGKWTSRPQRLALVYICGRAMCWRLNPSDETKSKVPPWYLPRPAQTRIEHPLVIDFLVWPGLRERLVFEFEKYTINGEFSFCFVEYFHFYWPYPDEQIAQYDQQTGLICGLSKLFREFIYNLRNWTMLPEFFARFPEMRADIDMWIEPPVIGFQNGHINMI